MSNIYVRLVSALVLAIAVLGFAAPALISAASTPAVLIGFALIVLLIPVEWAILRPFFRKLFS